MSAIPDVCFVSDVLRELRLSRRTFDRLRAANELPLIELDRIGRKLRYSGDSVRRAKAGRWATREGQVTS